MHDWYDIWETVAISLGHSMFTALSWGYTHWNGVGGALLMLLQGWYLIKKIKGK